MIKNLSISTWGINISLSLALDDGINGKIFSNWWYTDNSRGKIKSTIVIINPNNGVVEGLIGLDGLRDIIAKDQKLDQDEVLNGIAYDADNNRLFVTGKHWGKLFEIELIEK